MSYSKSKPKVAVDMLQNTKSMKPLKYKIEVNFVQLFRNAMIL